VKTGIAQPTVSKIWLDPSGCVVISHVASLIVRRAGLSAVGDRAFPVQWRSVLLWAPVQESDGGPQCTAYYQHSPLANGFDVTTYS